MRLEILTTARVGTNETSTGIDGQETAPVDAQGI